MPVIKPPIPNPLAIKPAVEEINEAALTTSEIFIRGSYFRDIVEKTQRLIDAANENGGKDNITVVLIEPFSDETR